MKPKSNINIWRYLPGILISAAAIYFLSRFVNLEDIIASFQLFSIIDILILAIMMVCSLIARGIVWKSLIDGLSLKDGFLIINEGYLFNNLIPRSGEIARIIFTSSLTRNDAFQTAAAIFFERSIDLLIAAGLFLSTLSMVLEMQWMKTTAIWIIVLFSLLLVLFLALAYFSSSVENYLREKRFKSKLIEVKIKPLAFRAMHGLTAINQPRKLAIAFTWIIGTWFFWIMFLYYGITQIYPGAPFWWSLFTEGVVALGIALPSAPASLGVYEGTIVFALSLFGINNDAALGAAILLHLIQIVFTMLFGLIGLFVHDFKLGQITQKILSHLGKKKTNESGKLI